jgi:tetratricopeptide (TPR) repeat protein
MKQNIILTLIIVGGFAAIFGLSNFIEQNRPPIDAVYDDQDLYFSGEKLKQMSLGFNGLIADYYWVSALQYIGHKMLNSKEKPNLDDLRPLNPRLLYPMLDTATTLDPDFTAAYNYGAVVLPAIDVEQAIKIAEKGIATQPDNWRFNQHLAYIYWVNKDFVKAAQVYADGAKKPNAPPWFTQMSARMQAEGGSRKVAREMYQQMYDEAENNQTKELAALRLLQIESFDERDAIRPILQNFQQKNGGCPNNWREVFSDLRTVKLPNGRGLNFDQTSSPLDPLKFPYSLTNQDGKCEVGISDDSKIPKL